MKFTYYTIIGKNLDLLKGHVKNVKEYAGFDKLPCEKEFLVIIYTNSNIQKEITQSLIEYCASENIRYVLYDEPTNVFIKNLYACWNLGYEASDEGYVFRGGSDQVFSKDSFLSLYEEAEKLRISGDNKFILQANTIENSVALEQIRAVSRHFACDFGGTFGSFDYSKFENFIEGINKNVNNQLLTINESLNHWGKPTPLQTSLGVINRADGCSWLMTKEEWRTYGPIPVIVNNVTGDVIIHDILQLDGYTEYIVRDCVTYHFVRGESMNQY
jgi:hypothetical protein